jgi:hypothetical protein
MFQGGSPAAEAYRLTMEQLSAPVWPPAKSMRMSLRNF